MVGGFRLSLWNRKSGTRRISGLIPGAGGTGRGGQRAVALVGQEGVKGSRTDRHPSRSRPLMQGAICFAAALRGRLPRTPSQSTRSKHRDLNDFAPRAVPA